MSIYKPKSYTWDACYIINEINEENNNYPVEDYEFNVLEQTPFEGSQEEVENSNSNDLLEYLIEDFSYCQIQKRKI